MASENQESPKSLNRKSSSDRLSRTSIFGRSSSTFEIVLVDVEPTTLIEHKFPPPPNTKHKPRTIAIREGDITCERSDVVVISSNPKLKLSGVVGDFTKKRGGRAVQKECDKWVESFGSVPYGKIAYTLAGELPCRFLIHAVPPKWEDDEEVRENIQLQYQCTYNCLLLANAKRYSSISIPPLVSGTKLGITKTQLAQTMIQAANDFFARNRHTNIEVIHFVLEEKDKETKDAFEKEFARRFIQGEFKPLSFLMETPLNAQNANAPSTSPKTN